MSGVILHPVLHTNRLGIKCLLELSEPTDFGGVSFSLRVGLSLRSRPLQRYISLESLELVFIGNIQRKVTNF